MSPHYIEINLNFEMSPLGKFSCKTLSKVDLMVGGRCVWFILVNDNKNSLIILSVNYMKSNQ